MIKLHVINYEDVWREGARDAKTLAAWALYEGLNREGAIKRELDRRFKESSTLDEDEEEEDDDDDDTEEDAMGGAEENDYDHEVVKR